MKSAMQPLVVAASLWLLPLLCTATEMDMEMESSDELVGGSGERTEKKSSFTQEECLQVVKKVEESKRYTEESITPVCQDVMGKSSNCDFFAEALSLASSHNDFQGKHFCEDMDRAQFCSGIMDKLLESTAVSDMAFGECERAKPQKNIEYCRRIQQMLGLSVKQEDLDTMRACYMMEAYTNSTATAAKAAPLEPNEESPKTRIITGSNKELDGVGKGGGPGHPPKTSNIGKGDIVVQPQPLENFGKGKGNMTTPKKILADPNPAGAAPAPAAGATAPAPAAPQTPAQANAAAGPIVAEPIPAPVATIQKTVISKVSVAPLKVAAAPKVVAAVAAPKAAPAKKVQALVAKAAVVAKPPAPVVLEVKTMDAKGQTAHSDKPLVAQAVMEGGKLVMTGAAFGRVEVDQKAIEGALKQAAAASKQQAAALAAKQPQAPAPKVVAKQAPAPKQAPAAKAVKPAPAPKQAAVAPKQAVAAPKPAAVVAPKAPVAAPAQAAKPAAKSSLIVAASAIKQFGVPVPPAVAATVAAAPVPPVVAAPAAKVQVATQAPPAKVQQPAPQQPIIIVVQAQPQPAPQAKVAPVAVKPAAAKPAVVVKPVVAAPVAKAAVAPAPVAVKGAAAVATTKVAAKTASAKTAPKAGAALKAVAKHTAGLAQKKESQYKGFLSGFVDY